jgi:hypothetical protein
MNVSLRSVALAAILVGSHASGARAQDAGVQAVPACEAAMRTMEETQQRLLDIAQDPDALDVHLVVSGILLSYRECPRPLVAGDAQSTMEGLIRFAAMQDASPLQRGVFLAALGTLGNRARHGVSIPFDALTFAVERGATEHARGWGQYALEQLADDPRVQDYLLHWARSEHGPPGYPNLPW